MPCGCYAALTEPAALHLRVNIWPENAGLLATRPESMAAVAFCASCRIPSQRSSSRCPHLFIQSCEHHETTACDHCNNILVGRSGLPPSPVGLCGSLRSLRYGGFATLPAFLLRPFRAALGLPVVSPRSACVCPSAFFASFNSFAVYDRWAFRHQGQAFGLLRKP